MCYIQYMCYYIICISIIYVYSWILHIYTSILFHFFYSFLLPLIFVLLYYPKCLRIMYSIYYAENVERKLHETTALTSFNKQISNNSRNISHSLQIYIFLLVLFFKKYHYFTSDSRETINKRRFPLNFQHLFWNEKNWLKSTNFLDYLIGRNQEMNVKQIRS